MLSYIITTAPRPHPTFDASLTSMRSDGGFDEHIYIYADGIDVGAIDNATVVTDGVTRLGGLRAWIAALQWLIDNTTSRWLVVLEDDITWAKVPSLQ